MMRVLAFYALLLLLSRVAESRVLSLRPSVFETYGSYTDNRRSLEHAGYATLTVKERQFITVGYSDLKISHPDWDYHQQMPVGGVLLSHLPFRVRAYYGHIQGRFTSPIHSDYSDRADLGSVEASFVQPWFEVGLAYARFSGNGLSYSDSLGGRAPRQHADQFTGRLTCLLNPRFSVTARHNYVRVLDGRRLLSLYMKAIYVPQRRWTLSAGGFIGERAYYFDNDLLVVFNQSDTQRGMIFGQIETRLWKGFSITAEYIYTHFESFSAGGFPAPEYSIRYLVAGVKSRFPL